MARSRATWPAIVFLTVVVQLVLWNLYVINRNNSLFEPNDRIVVRSKSIETLAVDNPMFIVSTTFATYHALKRTFAGKTIVIPEARRPHAFALERLSRLHVEVVREPMLLPAAVTERLKHDAGFIWELEYGTPLLVIVEPGAERYVLAWREDRAQELLISEATYLRERALAARR